MVFEGVKGLGSAWRGRVGEGDLSVFGNGFSGEFSGVQGRTTIQALRALVTEGCKRINSVLRLRSKAPHTQHNTTQHNTTQHNTTQHNTHSHTHTQHTTTRTHTPHTQDTRRQQFGRAEARRLQCATLFSFLPQHRGSGVARVGRALVLKSA